MRGWLQNYEYVVRRTPKLSCERGTTLRRRRFRRSLGNSNDTLGCCEPRLRFATIQFQVFNPHDGQR